MEEATQAMGKTAGKKKAKVLVGILVAVLGFTAWTWWFYVLHAPERDTKNYSAIEWMLHGVGMKMAYQNDRYGGETPEETLALYIDALEKRDVDLAARYYVPEKSNDIKVERVKDIEAGYLDRHIEIFRSASSSGNSLPSNRYYFSVREGQNRFEITLEQNQNSKLWKIVEP